MYVDHHNIKLLLPGWKLSLFDYKQAIRYFNVQKLHASGFENIRGGFLITAEDPIAAISQLSFRHRHMGNRFTILFLKIAVKRLYVARFTRFSSMFDPTHQHAKRIRVLGPTGLRCIFGGQ